VGFEKGYGQKRDVFQAGDAVRIDTERAAIITVKRIVAMLVPEQLQCQLLKNSLVNACDICLGRYAELSHF
jgi:hypothetical protein